MIRITPDTNVLISAFFYNGNERAILKAAIRGKLRFILSIEILDELIRVLQEKFGVDLEVTKDYVLRLNEVTDIVKPRGLLDVVVRDRKDVGVIECADAGGNCEYIITGDRDLLSLKRYKQIKIVTAGELVRTLKSEAVSSGGRERRPPV